MSKLCKTVGELIYYLMNNFQADDPIVAAGADSGGYDCTWCDGGVSVHTKAEAFHPKSDDARLYSDNACFLQGEN